MTAKKYYFQILNNVCWVTAVIVIVDTSAWREISYANLRSQQGGFPQGHATETVKNRAYDLASWISVYDNDASIIGVVLACRLKGNQMTENNISDRGGRRAGKLRVQSMSS